MNRCFFARTWCCGHNVAQGSVQYFALLCDTYFFCADIMSCKEGRGISLGGGSYAIRLGDALLLDAPDVGADLHGRSCVSQQTN